MGRRRRIWPRFWSTGRTTCTPSTAKHSESWTGKTRRSSFEAEDVWTTKLRHDWAIPLEQLANRSHRRDTQHFKLQEQTQNISIQTVSHGRIETSYQLHERLCDGLAIKKRYRNVIYITLHTFHSISNESCKPLHLNCEIKHNLNVMVCFIDLKYYEILQFNFCCFSSVTFGHYNS